MCLRPLYRLDIPAFLPACLPACPPACLPVRHAQVRLYRLFEFFHLLDYSLALSQGALMVVRNTTYVFYVTQ